MSKQIKYLNESGSIISAEQQASLEDYHKLTFIDGSIKIAEMFYVLKNITHREVSYFMDESESKNAILNRYSDTINKVNCILYFNKQELNGFTKWDWEAYSKDSILKFKGNEVYDFNHKLIFNCSFDLTTNELQEGAFKCYYANESEDPNIDRLLKFTYDENGDIDLIFDSNGNYGYAEAFSLNEFLADTNFSQVLFSWDQHTYFHSVNPFLPPSSKI